MVRNRVVALRGLALVAAIAAAMVAGPDLAAAAELSPEMKAVVDAANKEGELKVIWPANLLGGADGANQIVQNMNKMFGSNVKISHSPTGSLIGLGFQLANEAKAKVHASTDVYIAVVNVAPMMAQNNLLTQVTWEKLLPGRITPDLVELDGRVLRIATTLYGVTYNTRLLPNPPRTLDGWLAPQFKDKLATNPQGVGFDNLAAKDLWGPEKTLAYVRHFSAQVAGLLSCADQPRVASGEFVAMMFDCGAIDAIKMKEAGLPVDQVLLRDYTPVAYFYGAVPVNAQHPNAAELLIAYLLTEEGQRLQWDLWREDLASFPGSHLAPKVDAAVKDGAKPIEISAKWYMSNPDIEPTRVETVKILREGR